MSSNSGLSSMGISDLLGPHAEGATRIVLHHERQQKFRPMVLLELFVLFSFFEAGVLVMAAHARTPACPFVPFVAFRLCGCPRKFAARRVRHLKPHRHDCAQTGP